MFKVNNKDTKTTPNFEYISRLCSSISIVNFEQVNGSGVWWYWSVCTIFLATVQGNLEIKKDLES